MLLLLLLLQVLSLSSVNIVNKTIITAIIVPFSFVLLAVTCCGFNLDSSLVFF